MNRISDDYLFGLLRPANFISNDRDDCNDCDSVVRSCNKKIINELFRTVRVLCTEPKKSKQNYFANAHLQYERHEKVHWHVFSAVYCRLIILDCIQPTHV